MNNLKLYEINSNYILFLTEKCKDIYLDKDGHRLRKYIGIVLKINHFDYFAPLTSYKLKHKRMSNSIDFMKIKDIAAINLNKMIPVKNGLYTPVDFKKEKNKKYKSILEQEYRFIKSNNELIQSNANEIYKKVDLHPDSKLAKRCNDFKKLELLCESYNN